MNTEPIKHHYIPQFLLKNFCFDDKGHLYFYDKVSKQISIKTTKDVFMTSRLYEDTINNPRGKTIVIRDRHEFTRFEEYALKKRYGNDIPTRYSVSFSLSDLLEFFGINC